MRRTTLALVSLSLVLVSCGGATGRFTLSFKNVAAERQEELTKASVRVMERRLLAQEKKLVSSKTETTNGVTTVMVAASDSAGLSALKKGLQQPFSISILKQVPAGKGDIVSEKFGDFKELGISTESFDWVVAGSQTLGAQQQGFVQLEFTPQGQTILKKVFAENQGATIGVFVRGMLISKKVVEKSDTGEGGITIDGIPTPDLAQAFADDVNVGLHVGFTAN